MICRAVREEIEDPGQFLGYRAMQRKLREQHSLAVPHDLVYNVRVVHFYFHSQKDPPRMSQKKTLVLYIALRKFM